MATERMTAIVGARITEFKRKMAEVNKTMRKTATNVVVDVKVRYKKAQQRLDNIADTIRTLQTVGANMGTGSLIAISPGIIPVLAAAIGAVASLGPMIGVLAGSTFALATAFGFAGVAALAFGAAAIPTISKLFDENAKLNKQQKAARAELDKMKKTWRGIVKELEKPVLEAFSESMRITNKILKMSKPLFQSAAKAVNNLLDSLNASLDSSPVKAFFDYMNKEAGPMLETIGKSVGNFLKGFLSMMVAFGPLAKSTAQGFLEMSRGFADWAAGLSKSEKFQAFVSYVTENMPKLRAIFRDATAGLIYMFSAFAPLSADMMSGLQDMMARFKEWGKSLSENQQFQKFIGYIRENAPKVMTLIGNLADLIVNLGVAMAPLGSKILDIVNGFLEWTNNMMKTNPTFGKFIGYIIVAIGVFQALWPLITVVTTMFSGLGGVLLKLFPKLGPIFTMFKMNMIIGLKMIGQSALNFGLTIARMGGQVLLWLGKMLAQAMIWAVRMAASWLIAMGPIGWIILAVTALVALVIWKWDEIKAWTIKTFTKIAAFLVKTWASIKSKVIQFVANLVSSAVQKFNELKNKVSQKMQEAKAKIVEIWNGIKSFINGINLYNSGKKIIQSVIDGMGAMKAKAVSKVKEIAGAIRDFFPFSPAKEGPLSTLHRLDFAGPVGDSIARARSSIQTAMQRMLSMSGVDIGLNPALAGGAIGGSFEHTMKATTPSRYESKSKENVGVAIVEALNGLVLENKIVVNEKEIIEATGKPMMRYIDKETKGAGTRKGQRR